MEVSQKSCLVEEQDRVINVFWTGGWDSTYRMVELSRMGVMVRPIYCCDPGRKSILVEKMTMNRILEALVERKETTSVFLPIEYIDLENVPENEEISSAFRTLSNEIRIGSQYDWLARVALRYPGVEIGIEKPHGEYSGCVSVIERFGKLKKIDGKIVLDQECSTKECSLVMGNFSFPIIEKTEVEMVRNIEKWGYDDIMQMIWFCHCPLDEQPCGMCRPCQQKMECNMQSLLPKKAQRRYRVYMTIKRLFGEYLAKRLTGVLYRQMLKRGKS